MALRKRTARRAEPRTDSERTPLPALEVRWRGFRGFTDTGWLRLRPLTLIIGPNNTGKTSLVAPLLLLKQTLESPDLGSPLITDGEYFHGGAFSELFHEQDVTKPMIFGLRFDDFEDGDQPPVGRVPPGGLELAFVPSTDGSPTLQRYSVQDRRGRPFLDRQLQPSGAYSLESIPHPEGDRGQRELIASSPPEGFLFTSRSFMRLALPIDLDTSVRSAPKLAISSLARLYMAIVDYTRDRVQALLSSISYIGPLRSPPQRVYAIGTDPITSVGVGGRHAAELLDRRQDLAATVNKWTRRLEFGHQIDCHRLTKGAFELLIQQETGVTVNLADTGFGLSQTLPILVQSAALARGEMLIVEQPEIHLNPRLQYELADLFAETVQKGCRVVVETHSEHLFLRMRRLLAERKLAREDVTVLYVEKQGKKSVVREVPIGSDGSISADDWPDGFFEDSLKEALKLAMAQAERTDS